MSEAKYVASAIRGCNGTHSSGERTRLRVMHWWFIAGYAAVLVVAVASAVLR